MCCSKLPLFTGDQIVHPWPLTIDLWLNPHTLPNHLFVTKHSPVINLSLVTDLFIRYQGLNDRSMTKPLTRDHRSQSIIHSGPNSATPLLIHKNFSKICYEHVVFYNEVDLHILLFVSVNENCFNTSIMAAIKLHTYQSLACKIAINTECP